MEVDLVLKVAGVGMLVAVICQILSRTGRDEQSTMVSLAGVILILILLAEKVGELADYVDASFVVDDLNYLAKGGRCSTIAALGANLLKLKPCITVKGGAMGVEKKYRGRFAAR